MVALFSLSSSCLVMVVWLFFALPGVCLRFVIVIFPDHTHLLLLVDVFKVIHTNYQGSRLVISAKKIHISPICK